MTETETAILAYEESVAQAQYALAVPLTDEEIAGTLKQLEREGN